MKQSIYLRIQFNDKMEDSSCLTENRCRKSSSREFRRRWGFHSYSLHRQRCDPTLGARHEDANVRRFCRVKETSRAKSVWPEESHKMAIVLSGNHQLKIPEHIPNRN